ncbi:MAG: DUF2723 domain-containing protein [Candidatus Muirbacterium halophilum]|nr:DUF2723 domain-containing protein [Candidatus Muirbacterium halophilum]MCK9476000.1 DUF2723 domain-containing protein [Candidatus Muirbacterium halophilum]
MDKKIILLFFLICFLFLAPYLNNIVDKGDGGEFILTTKYLGNSHPSGYVLYNLIGRLFHILPLKSELCISIMSLFFLCGSCIVLFFIINDILENIYFSVAGSFCLLFGKTFCGVGTTQEIYSMFIFFFLLSLYFYFKILNTDEENYYALMLFSLGLMTTVHITGAIYAVIIFICVFISAKRYKIINLFYFILPCLLYFYLIIRNNAYFSWGEINNINSLISFLTGSERGVGARFFAMTLPEYFYQLSVFAKHYIKEFSFMWFFSIPGIYFLWKFEKRYLYPLISSFVFCIVFFTSVARNLIDKQHFFLISFSIQMIFIITGIYFMHNLLAKGKKPLYLCLFPIMLLFFNKPNYTQLYVLERYADNIENSINLNEKSNLFVENDEITFRLWVRKYIYNKFENIDIINKDMLNASWYSAKNKNIIESINSNIKVYCDIDPDIYRFYSLPQGLVYKIIKEFDTTEVNVWENIILSEGEEFITLSEVKSIRKRYSILFNDIAFQLALENKWDMSEDFIKLAIERDLKPEYMINLDFIKNKRNIFEDEIDKLIYFKYFDKAKEILIKNNDLKRLAEHFYKMEDYESLSQIKDLPFFYKGINLFIKNDYAQALEFFKKSEHIDSDYYIALILYKYGQIKQSIKIMESLTLKYPEIKKYNEFLMKIKGYISITGK